MNSVTSEKNRPMLTVSQASKRFAETTALDEVSFTVPEASFTVILGPAGAGKTTTLRTIAGLERPDSGNVILNGHDVGGWEPKDRDVAMIFDNLALYPNKTGFQNMANHMLIHGEKPEAIKERVHAVAATLQISRVLDRLPKTMSGGEKQRVALGRVLVRTPNIFLLDEPLSSLDAKLRIELRAELRRLQSEHGRTFLMATPDYNEALAIADEIIMLRLGRVVQTAAPQELYDLPVDRKAALFVGSPLINLLPARFTPGSGGGTVQVAGGEIDAPQQIANAMAGQVLDFEMGVRPENLALADADSAPLCGELVDVEPLGLKSVLTVKNTTAELRLLVASAAAATLSVGETIGVNAIHTDKMLAFDQDSGCRLS